MPLNVIKLKEVAQPRLVLTKETCELGCISDTL